MSYLQTEIVSHTRRVCSLYKRATRLIRDYAPDTIQYRYHAVLLRDKFEQNRNLRDGTLVQKLLCDGENELFTKQHYAPMKFPTSPGGVAHGRDWDTPDWVLDFWAPEEKAQYPEYFAKREQRKKEYIAYYEKKFGVKAEMPHLDHH